MTIKEAAIGVAGLLLFAVWVIVAIFAEAVIVLCRIVVRMARLVKEIAIDLIHLAQAIWFLLTQPHNPQRKRAITIPLTGDEGDDVPYCPEPAKQAPENPLELN